MGKLIRDKIPDIIRKDGKVPITRILNDEEYLPELKKKAVEEAKELESATTREEIIGELVDLQELILASLSVIGSSPKELEVVRLKKLEEKGGFTMRVYWNGNE